MALLNMKIAIRTSTFREREGESIKLHIAFYNGSPRFFFFLGGGKIIINNNG